MKVDPASLDRKIKELAPWHLKVEVAEGVSTIPSGKDTVSSAGSGPVSFLDTEERFKKMIRSVYPNGLGGRTFLDVACNCGAYSFWMQELGASRCFGFDAREHWIRQAEFLKSNRAIPSHQTKFAMLDVYDLPTAGLESADISMFEGIFYHLPDPIGALRIVSDKTNEMMIFDTALRRATRRGMVLAKENSNFLMNGMHGLNWYPTSSQVVIDIMKSLGFVEFRLLYDRRFVKFNAQRGAVAWLKAISLGTGRMHLLAAKHEGYFDDFDASGYRIR